MSNGRNRRYTQLFSVLCWFVCVLAAALRSASAQYGEAPPLSGLVPDHATLSVESLDLEANWYTRVLGFKVSSKSETDPAFLNWHLVIPGYRIDLIKYKGSKRPVTVDPIYMQQGWIHVVFHLEDIDAAWKALQALHVEAKVSRDSKGKPIQLLLKDPEGNEIEIRRNVST